MVSHVIMFSQPMAKVPTTLHSKFTIVLIHAASLQPQQSFEHSDYSTVKQSTSTNYFNLKVGSAVELVMAEPNKPPLYGVIRWIGTPGYLCQYPVAGIELVRTI